MRDSETIETIAAQSGSKPLLRGGLVLAVILGLAVAGWWYFSSASSERAATRYITTPAKVTDIVVTVAATGTVEPTNKVEISSELSGTVRSVEVDYNDRVKVGQVLARLDTTKLEAVVEQRRASLVAAQARVTEAEATVAERRDALQRAETLANRGISTQEQLITAKAAFDRAEAALTSAEADVRVQQANLEVEEANLAKACICSSINGVILDRDVSAGQIVASSLQAPVLFVIAEDLAKMELLVDVDEADIGEVAVGNPATFTVEAFQNRSFPAKIEQIRYAPETVDGVVTYKAVLTVENPDLLLRPGMTATAEITVDRFDKVLSVANAALRYSPLAEEHESESGSSGLLGMLFRRPGRSEPSSNEAVSGQERTVWVLRNGESVGVKVRTGATDGRFTEIAEGDLAEGDLLITGEQEG